MTSAQRHPSMLRSAVNPATLLLATMPIQWVSLAHAGPFSIKLVYVAFLAVVVAALMARSVVNIAPVLVLQNASWCLPYAIYLLILGLALYGSPAETMAPRQVLYLFGCLSMAGLLATRLDASSILRIGALLGLLAFILVVEVKAWENGLSWTIAVPRFLTTGDLDFIVYSFFRGVFNSAGDDGEITVKAAEKNTVAVCVFVLGLLFRIGFTRRGSDWLGFGITMLVMFLIVLLNTRSVLLVSGLALVLVAVLRHRISKRMSTAGWIGRFTGIAFAAGITAIVVSADHPVNEVIFERLAFADDSTEGRVVQYEDALSQIEENLLLGSGYYQSVGRTIHNLFLSSWVHAGLPAFLLVVAFYGALLATWLGLVLRIVQRPELWVIATPFEWVAVLPLLPAFRVWLSGDAGHLFLGEWIALACFFGLVLRNRLLLAEEGQMKNDHVSLSADQDPQWSSGFGARFG